MSAAAKTTKRSRSRRKAPPTPPFIFSVKESINLDFMFAIFSQPQDPLLPLVYADWLEERGQTWAEYIRLSQVRQETVGKQDPESRRRNAIASQRYHQLRGHLYSYLAKKGHVRIHDYGFNILQSHPLGEWMYCYRDDNKIRYTFGNGYRWWRRIPRIRRIRPFADQWAEVTDLHAIPPSVLLTGMIVSIF